MGVFKLLSSLAAILFFSVHTSAQTEGIRVEISKLRNSNGHVLISLYRDGNGYPDDPEKAIRKARISIKNNTAWVVFTGLPAGEYAVAILHDENDDQKMNKTMLGLPNEGYGFSNNVMGTFGPPSFNRASFAYTAKNITVVDIKTRY
jgi:uncharacterized protein (DUF2141 family)